MILAWGQVIVNNFNEFDISLSFPFSLLEQEEGGTEARQLTQRACKVHHASILKAIKYHFQNYVLTTSHQSTLTLGEQQRLLTELERDPQVVSGLGLTPAKFPDLVENNPMIAIEILLILMQARSEEEGKSLLENYFHLRMALLA